MAVNLPALDGILAVPGVRVAASRAGIKHLERDDIALLVLSEGSTVCGVFTRSSFRAAPVRIAESRIAKGGIRALIINSGNANAATGDPGVQDALVGRWNERYTFHDWSTADNDSSTLGLYCSG